MCVVTLQSCRKRRSKHRRATTYERRPASVISLGSCCPEMVRVSYGTRGAVKVTGVSEVIENCAEGPNRSGYRGQDRTDKQKR